MINLRDWGATGAEVDAPMPGDDLIVATRATCVASGTRSITVAASPARVFDFLTQMGFGRAGWYSYDWVDNLGRTSAFELHDEWMVTSAGDQVPGGPIAFTAAVVERPERFVLQVPRRCVGPWCIDFTLAYRLVATSAMPERTRIVSRVRIAISGPLGSHIATGLLLADGAMVRKQLLGLKLRSERAA